MGRIYEKQTDPPGQKCKYILPGNSEKETYRLSTFLKFPQNAQVDPVELAAHGFLYTGYKDRVKCYCCGSNVLDWNSGDDPRSAKWHFEGCELVLGTDSRNVPIGRKQCRFTGTFEKSRLVSGPTRMTSHENEPQTASIVNPVLNNLPEDRSSVEDLSEELNAIQINQNNVVLESNNSTPSVTQRTVNRQMTSFRNDSNNLVKTCENTLNSLGLQKTAQQGQVQASVEEPSGPSSKEKKTLQSLFPCLNPINPRMRYEADRESTFNARWPRDRVLATPKQIAKAGFYFLGERDRTKCWYCNGGLQNWSRTDEPFTEHAKWFPGCEFVLRCKGAAFVQKVVADFPNLKRPPLRSSRFDVATNQVIPIPSANEASSSVNAGSVLLDFQPSNVNSGNEVFSQISTPILEKLKTMGFKESRIKAASERWFQKERRGFNTIRELVEELVSEPRNVREPSQNVSRSEGENPVLDPSLKRINQKSNANSKSGETPVKKTKPSNGANTDLQKTLMDLESERKCRVCNKKTADCVIMMCGHLVVCHACSANLKRCPVCAAEVSDIIRAYLS